MEDSDHLALEGQWSRYELKTLANRVNTSRSAHAVEGRKILNCFGAFYKYKSGQKIVGCVVTTRRILATLQLQGNENGRVVTIALFYRYQINTWRFAIFSRLVNTFKTSSILISESLNQHPKYYLTYYHSSLLQHDHHNSKDFHKKFSMYLK